MVVKQIMADILSNFDLYPELVAAFVSLSSYGKYMLVSSIKNMNRGMLYESPIHGAYHSEKVTLFSILLGTRLGCTDKEIEILADAAMYHDFMRETDNEDSFHGLGAANNIARVIPKGKYTPSELSLLKSIMDFHSTDINKHGYDMIAEDHEVDPKDVERGRILAHILRDADALDRCRFSKDSSAYLKPEYLHFPESHDFIKLSEEINEAYISKMFTDEEVLSNKFLYRNMSPCLHSVGKNFFRINSVLEHGLLSYSRLCKLDSSFQRNFDGGNSDKWISVVPRNKLKLDGGATKEFLKNGIVFLFDEIQLYYPDERVTSSYARSYGLPYTKNSGYADEQYAFDFIPKEKIIGICVDEKFAKQRLHGLEHYVYDSFTYELFEKNVKSFLKELSLLENGNIPSELMPIMNKYKDITIKAENASLMCQDLYAEEMMKLSHVINMYIGKELENYYRRQLGYSEDTVITVRDALEYELSKSNYNCERINDSLYMVSPREEIKGKKAYL